MSKRRLNEKQIVNDATPYMRILYKKVLGGMYSECATVK